MATDGRSDKRFVLQVAGIAVLTMCATLLVAHFFMTADPGPVIHTAAPADQESTVWHSPDISRLDTSDSSQLIRYGRELIANTSVYLGPRGSVQQLSNGMTCQNCHLDAGTKLWGNNYSAVAATYPKYRERSGSVESIYKRINDCMQRSLNGKPLDTASREMQAMRTYILWLGRGTTKGQKVKGAGIKDLAYLPRAADPQAGRAIYSNKCQSCHREDGQGILQPDGRSYQYPPLWGQHSFNSGAGLYRLSRIAGYVRYNMPLGVTYDAPQLTDEQAWDVAAYICSQPRPAMDLSHDWPHLSGKPVDHPFGPYADTFTERQHKYGPFGPIAATRKAK